MTFEWDAENIAHIADNHMRPGKVESAINDPNRFARYLGWVNGERRVLVIGRAGRRLILVVIVAPRPGILRVVTAYKADRRMERVYWGEETS